MQQLVKHSFMNSRLPRGQRGASMIVVAPARLPSRRRGFSLLEVLVTLVLVAIGLLGVAGMQIAAIKLADAAEVRSKAVLNMESIVERIRTNPNNAASYAVSLTGSVSSGPATADVTAWKAALAANLLSGQGSITVADDNTCASGLTLPKCQLVTIIIKWSEPRAKRTAIGGNAVDTVEFKTVVRV
jgi:type IV pilus assembly protein PilV